MTDREMLELAARAGSCVVKGAVLPGGRSDGWWGLYLEKENDTGAFQEWNPLDDDGDALRLAVQCGILNLDDALFYGDRDIDYQTDPCAATRRAIVRAAAEIGRQMEEQS